MAIAVTANQWNLVAEDVAGGYIDKLNNHRKFGRPSTRVWQNCVDTGEAAPTDMTDAVIWDDLTLDIKTTSNIDIYLYPLVDMQVRVKTYG